MKLSTSVLSTILSLYISKANAAGGLGFNLGVENSDGTCKTASDYESDLESISAYSTNIKTYAASTCNTLEILGPVVEAKGFTWTLGIWPTDDSEYAAEKAALKSYLGQISASTLEAITVGSEALYRADLTASELADKIKEIKELVSGLTDKDGNSFSSVKVGTVDSWDVLVDGASNDAIVEADIVYANAFSYWQGQTMSNSSFSFFDDIMQVLQTIQTVKGSTDIEFWVGETGWPTDGENYESSSPSVSNAKQFWQEAICSMRGWGVNTYVFEAFDETWKPATSDTGDTEKHWGVWDDTRTLKYALSCDYSS